MRGNGERVDEPPAYTGRTHELPRAKKAVPGRTRPSATSERLAVTGGAAAMRPERRAAIFATGCFRGAERMFRRVRGAKLTAAGYIAGHTPNPTTARAWTATPRRPRGVRPRGGTLEALTKAFFEAHHPTHARATTSARSPLREIAERAGRRCAAEGAPLRTDHHDDPPRDHVLLVEEHQQYLHEVPHGYCGLGGTGVGCPLGTGAAA